MFTNELGQNEHLYRGPYIDASYKKSSTLKPLRQMNQNFVGSIYGRSSIWPPQAILITDLSISQKSSPLKPRFIWRSGFRVEDFLEINQSETRIACGGPVCQRIGTK
jgi:hypothetical protein